METSNSEFVACYFEGVERNCSALTGEVLPLYNVSENVVVSPAPASSPPSASFFFIPSAIVLLLQLFLFVTLFIMFSVFKVHTFGSKIWQRLKHEFDEFSRSTISFCFIVSSKDLVDFYNNTNRIESNRHLFAFAVIPSKNWQNRFLEQSAPPVETTVAEPKQPEVEQKLEKDVVFEKEGKRTINCKTFQMTNITDELHQLLPVPKKPTPPSVSRMRRKSTSTVGIAAAAAATAVSSTVEQPQKQNNQSDVKKDSQHDISTALLLSTPVKSSTVANFNSESSAHPKNAVPPSMSSSTLPVGSASPPPPPPPPLPATLDNKNSRLPKPSRPVKCFNWVPLPDFKIHGTVWEHVKFSWPCILKRIDLIELEEIFSQKAPGRRSSTPRPTSDRSGRSSVGQVFSVIDSRRAHHLNILLSSAVRLPIDELVNLISTMDTNNTLSADVCSNLIRNFPTDEEIRILCRFRDHLANFASADRFLWELSQIPRGRQKLSALVYRKTFNENVDVVRPKLEALINCSRQMRESVAFRRTLEITLAIGNFLNSFSRPKSVNGFRLSCLARLGDTKSSKRATFSLIDYIRKVLLHPPVCKHCSDNNLGDDSEDGVGMTLAVAEQPIRVSQEITDLKAASVVGELGSLLQEIASLRAGMSKVEQESQEIPKSITDLLPVPVSPEQLEKSVASEKAFKDAMALFCHLEGGKLVELEKLFEVAVDEYRRTLIYFGEAEPTLDSEALTRSIEITSAGPDNDKEPSIFTVVERFITKLETTPVPMPPSFYTRRAK